MHLGYNTKMLILEEHMGNNRKWWKEGVVYQIYPRSFQDTNGDGIGDLQGIIAHLDDLKELGVGTIWLSPVYKSPNVDNGYDISDYRAIHPDYGTMTDMDQLIAEATKRNLKIIMDLVINHTSDEHPWFQASRDPDSPYRSYYYWREGIDGKAPNNWTSFFAEDCWEFDAKSNAYYLHLFAKKQPDLNYHNPKVIEEIKDIMRFWLNKGISGFRCDVINIIYKTSLENGKKKMILTGSEHYISQEGMHVILRSLKRDVLKGFDCFTVGETVFVTPEMGRDLCDASREELDMIFSFEHMETDQYFVKWFKRKFNPEKFMKTLTKWQIALEWNANYFENHDQPRSVSRFGDDEKYWSESAKMLATLLLTLKGTPFLYQGQEIGMTNFDFSTMDELRDIESFNVDKMAKGLLLPKKLRFNMMRATSRDNSRTPYQWNRETHAGFTTGDPWINVNKNYFKINYLEQKANDSSILCYYKKAIKVRAENEVLIYGTFEAKRSSGNVYIYQRRLSGELATVILNFGKKTHTVSITGKVLLSNYDKEYFNGILLPYEAVVLIERSFIKS
jgi:oligo-1,6-glucosidase